MHAPSLSSYTAVVYRLRGIVTYAALILGTVAVVLETLGRYHTSALETHVYLPAGGIALVLLLCALSASCCTKIQYERVLLGFITAVVALVTVFAIVNGNVTVYNMALCVFMNSLCVTRIAETVMLSVVVKKSIRDKLVNAQ